MPRDSVSVLTDPEGFDAGTANTSDAARPSAECRKRCLPILVARDMVINPCQTLLSHLPRLKNLDGLDTRKATPNGREAARWPNVVGRDTLGP